MRYTSGQLFNLIRLGQASSRADLVRLTKLSPSTVAARVSELIDHGFLEETGEGASSGGRRPRLLTVRASEELIAGVDLSETHATIILIDRSNTIVAEGTCPAPLELGPQEVCENVHAGILDLVNTHGSGQVAGIGLSLPGPVDSRTGELLSPTRMPGWNGVDVAKVMTQISGIPAVVENDANALALGEHSRRRGTAPHLLFIKAGSGIGCGIIADGQIHRGYRGVAGDISHVTLPGVPPIACSCGRVGCLDVVASGSAIVDELQAEGVDVDSITELLDLADQGNPLATGLLRQAGQHLGGVLATIVNFFNPQTLVLGGLLSGADAFVAGIRQEIFTQCLPMTTDLLEISISTTAELGAAEGIAGQVLETLLTPEAVDAALATEE